MANEKATRDMLNVARARALTMLESSLTAALEEVVSVSARPADDAPPTDKIEALIAHHTASMMSNVVAMVRATLAVDAHSVNYRDISVLRFPDEQPTLVKLEGEQLTEYRAVLTPARLLAGLMGMLWGVGGYSAQIAASDDERAAWADLHALCEAALLTMDASTLAQAIVFAPRKDGQS